MISLRSQVEEMSREIKTHKNALLEKEFRLSEYRDHEKLQQVTNNSPFVVCREFQMTYFLSLIGVMK